MDKKFKKNDKLLFHAFIITDIFAILIFLCGILHGIITILDGAKVGAASIVILGVVEMILIFPIVAFVFRIFITVTLNMYCDVKLIRNKLYNKDNGYLASLTESNGTIDGGEKLDDVPQTAGDKDAGFSNLSKLKELKCLLDEEILTQEEYDAEKQKLLHE